MTSRDRRSLAAKQLLADEVPATAEIFDVEEGMRSGGAGRRIVGSTRLWPTGSYIEFYVAILAVSQGRGALDLTPRRHHSGSVVLRLRALAPPDPPEQQ